MHRDDSSLDVRIASPSDQPAGLELAWGHLAPAERQGRIAERVSASPSGLVDGLWVGYRGHDLAAAMLATIQPGRTAVVNPPRAAPGQPTQTAAELLVRVVDRLASGGVRLAQALIESDHGPDAQVLVEAGFHHAANLLYLVSLRSSFPTAKPDDALQFEPYTPARHARLAELVERTYRGSLDCPCMEGLRQIDDVLAGYRCAGVFDPSRWLIVGYEQRDIGCLLLAPHPTGSSWEINYMGLVPEARGAGFGVTIVRHAQWLAALAGCERLVLAVDADNVPAIAVYAAAGFVAWDHRSVFLRVL